MQTPQFAITPEQEELESLPREFGFAPADPRRARTFSAEEVERYNREGYLSGVTLLEDEEAAEWRVYFDELLARTLASGADSYSISSAHMQHGRVYDLLTDRRIVDRAADLLGDDCIGWGAHFFCKMPGDGKQVAWHQDAGYWPLSPSRTVTVWLAIDDADRENACVRFLPGTHNQGLIAWRPSAAEEANVLRQTVEEVERFGEPVYVELKAGQASFHADLLLHGSDANRSPRRRCGLTLRYCSAEVRAWLDWNQKGVVVRGEDRAGHWSNFPRPQTD